MPKQTCQHPAELLAKAGILTELSEAAPKPSYIQILEILQILCLDLG